MLTFTSLKSESFPGQDLPSNLSQTTKWKRYYKYATYVFN